MFSFELSAFDLVLSVGVIVLIVLFVATLLKLNPSSENKESENAYAHEEELELAAPAHEPDQPAKASVPHAVMQSTERTTSEKLQQPPQLTVSATADGTSQESLEQAPKTYGHKGPRNHKAPEVKQAPKGFEEKDCFHFFGYLGGLAKNTPIPGECFGCQRIVDCLITPKKKP